MAAAIAQVLPPDSPLAPGSMLHEYRLLEKLGSGGMGTVYRALHVRLDKEVALKVIHPLRVRDPRVRQRFGREMKAIGKLRHPHIVLATDAGEAQGVLYLVMELEHGADLAHYARGQGRLPIAEACAYAQQAALGLQCAHEAGLVHRDVKPSNLFRTASGQIKLLDLGLARLEVADEAPPVTTETPLEQAAAADWTPLGTAGTRGPMGTDDYMAPEQWGDAHQVDARADLYSLGCTLFFLLTGQPPFTLPRPASRGHIREAHLHTAPPPLRSLRPDAPAWLEALVHRLLAKRPEERPASAAEVARQFARYSRPSPRRAAWAGVAFAIVAAIAAIPLVLSPPQPDYASSTPSEPPAQSSAGFNPAVVKQSVVKQPVEPPPAGTLPMNSVEAQQLQRQWAVHLQRPVTFTNSVGMEFVLVPPGTFRDVDGRDTAISDPFYLAASEVTMRQFRQFVESERFVTEAQSNGQGGCLVNAENLGQNPQNRAYVWSSPGIEVESEDCPVVQVTWNDTLAFCLWLGKKEQATYRLQTGAQWAWTCRCGQQGLDYIGSVEQLAKQAWIKANSENHPHAVRTRLPNAWGLYDLHGNVGEWCRDDVDAERLEKILGRPAPFPGLLRVAAGSNYSSQFSNYRLHTTRTPPTTATSALGFRVVCEIPPAGP